MTECGCAAASGAAGLAAAIDKTRAGCRLSEASILNLFD